MVEFLKLIIKIFVIFILVNFILDFGSILLNIFVVFGFIYLVDRLVESRDYI